MVLIVKRRGFTLVESLIVVFILGLLIAVVVPKLVGNEDAKLTKERKNISLVEWGIALYQVDYRALPVVDPIVEPVNAKTVEAIKYELGEKGVSSGEIDAIYDGLKAYFKTINKSGLRSYLKMNRFDNYFIIDHATGINGYNNELEGYVYRYEGFETKKGILFAGSTEIDRHENTSTFDMTIDSSFVDSGSLLYATLNNNIKQASISGGEGYINRYLIEDGADIKAIKGTNIVPTMTSNTSPSGVSTASTVNDPVYFDAYYAFDNDDTTAWATEGNTTIGWIKYEFTNSKTITQYTIYPRNEATYGLAQAPKKWTFEGWDGSSWLVLDEQSNIIDWSLGVGKKFHFDNGSPYISYQLNVSENNGDGYALAIGTLELVEKNWAIVGTSPVTKVMFDNDGIDDLRLIPRSAWSELGSSFDLLNWTDETGSPTRTITVQ